MSRPVSVAVALLAIAAAGCGSFRGSTTAPVTTAVTTGATRTPAAPTTTTPTVTTTTANGPGGLQAEANATAAGDIPDNQVFLVFRSRAGYSIKFPEGWAQRGPSRAVVFRDKNNVVRVVVMPGVRPTPRSVRRELAKLAGLHVLTPPQRVDLPGDQAVKVVYATESVPNAVTGKRVTLVVDRYYLWRTGRHRRPGIRAIVDLGTPRGVDNVDAYRLMIESFRWR